MGRQNTLLWLLAGAGVLYLVSQRKQVTDTLETGAETVTAAIAGWKQVKDGPVWVPVINATESSLGIPQDLLARMAYQESHFRPEIIDGTQASPAGALGILQLMPQWFSAVRVARPFTQADTVAQVSQAGQELIRLYTLYGDWALALAAYNWGQGNVSGYLTGAKQALPLETQHYVSEILADVPVADPGVLNA